LGISSPIGKSPAAANSSEIIGLAVLFVRATYLRIMKTKNARQTVKRQNLRNRKHKDENFRRKDNTLEVERNLRTSDALRKKVLQQRCCKTFMENGGTVKKILTTPPSIYRKEGGSPEKPPRYDRCEFSGRRVSTPMFQG
jgi:hypothetical protein